MRVFLILLLALSAFPALATSLCTRGEKIALSFSTKSKKIVSLCIGRSGEYLVYRFGKPGTIELQYPTVLDSSSWGLFSYGFYVRNGGVVNSAFSRFVLSFSTAEAEYVITDAWYSEDNFSYPGIDVTTNKRSVALEARKAFRKGGLATLQDFQAKMPERDWTN